jgi:hypothetical protein
MISTYDCRANDTVDFTHVEPGGSAVLTVSDHLPWDNIDQHLYCLQEKLNTYLRFIRKRRNLFEMARGRWPSDPDRCHLAISSTQGVASSGAPCA